MAFGICAFKLLAFSDQQIIRDECFSIKDKTTKKKMFDFWGDALTNLPAAAKEIHQKKGTFFINNRHPVSFEGACHELAIVSYTGTGKYDNCTLVPWIELPDTEDVA